MLLNKSVCPIYVVLHKLYTVHVPVCTLTRGRAKDEGLEAELAGENYVYLQQIDVLE